MRSTAKKKKATAKPSGDQHLPADVGGAAAAHGRVPAGQQPAVRREPLHDGVGPAALGGAGEVAARAGRGRGRRRRRWRPPAPASCVNAMTSRARPPATPAPTSVSRTTASRRPHSMPKIRRPATSSTTACASTVTKTETNLPPMMTPCLVGVVKRRGRVPVAVLGEDRPRHVRRAEEHEEDHHAGENEAGDCDLLLRPRGPWRTLADLQAGGHAAGVAELLGGAGGEHLRVEGVVAPRRAGRRPRRPPRARR